MMLGTTFSNYDRVFKSEKQVKNKYCVNVKAKRIYDISSKSKKQIDEYLDLPKGGYYAYFNFDFKLY